MPTVAVYVPADLFRRLGSEDARVREIALGALEREAGLGAGEPEAVRLSPAVAATSVASAPAATEKRASPAPSPLAEREDSAIDSSARRGRAGSASRARAGDQASRSASGCRADTPRGTRCKLCGETH